MRAAPLWKFRMHGKAIKDVDNGDIGAAIPIEKMYGDRAQNRL